MCCFSAVLLLLLLLLLPCLRYVVADYPREHGYYASQPLSVMCLPILQLEYGSMRFGSCTSTASQLTFGVSAEVSWQHKLV